MTKNLIDFLNQFIYQIIPEQYLELFTPQILAKQILLIAVIIGSFYISRTIIRNSLNRWIIKQVVKSNTNWDNILYHQKVFQITTSLIPVFIVYYLLQQFFPSIWPLTGRVLKIYIAFHLVYLFDRFMAGVNQIYESYPVSKRKPIKGYLQLFKIFLYILAGTISLSIIVGESPLALLSGLGALTAVLLLVFKDTILSFVASIQVASNDMVRMGDWIEMPQYGADGEVTEIALHTIKVQNWDKTYTTIPMHKIMEAPFKNWRGMDQSGGRRIKRSILIDMQSVELMSQEELNKVLATEELTPYSEQILEKAEPFITENGPNKAFNLTNLGVFRIYMETLLAEHHRLHTNMTCIVRTLAPSFEGIPLEIYTFSRDTAWVVYEQHQSTLVEHIIATLPLFNLKIAQAPTGTDFQLFNQTLNG